MANDDIHRAAAALRSARRITVLTGAGISAESGVPTFRGPDGLWRKFRVEDLATPEAFAHDPVLVWEWYDWRRGLIAKCDPNPGHFSLAKFEGHFTEFLLVTQNVDGLHRKAGNRKVAELHGNIWDVRCLREGTVREDLRVPLPEIPPRCECGALLRPNVVWFGEALPQEVFAQATRAAMQCDLFFVIGTSGLVQPAASLPLYAKRAGAVTIELNLEPTPLSPLVDHSFLGRSGHLLPKLEELLS